MIRKTLIIAKREYLATVLTKAFIIGLVLMPVFMGGSVIGMMLLRNSGDTHDRAIAILDPTGTIAPVIIEAAEKRNAENLHNKEGKKIRPAWLFHEEPIPDMETLPEIRLSLSNQVRRGKLFGFVEIGKDILDTSNPQDTQEKVGFYSKNPVLDDLRGWLVKPVNQRIRDIHLEELGLPRASVNKLLVWHTVEGMKLIEADKTGKAGAAKKADEMGAVFVPTALVMLMFMMIMMGAMPLLNSVMEEKNQHIAEALLSSVTPFAFMMGKVLGGVAISLTASAIYLGVAVFALTNFGLMGYAPLSLIPWFLAYIILAILMMGSIMAAIGSACTDLKESQNLTLPAMLPILIPMFIMMPILKEPTSTFATVVSLIPPMTPILMILRQASPGGVPLWQPILGLVGLSLFTLLCVWMGSRIFRVSILLKGTTPNLATLIRWAIKG